MINFKIKKVRKRIVLFNRRGKVSTRTKANVSDLRRNKYQPRKSFNESSLNELTDSIKSRGIIQPIIVEKPMVPVSTKL